MNGCLRGPIGFKGSPPVAQVRNGPGSLGYHTAVKSDQAGGLILLIGFAGLPATTV